MIELLTRPSSTQPEDTLDDPTLIIAVQMATPEIESSLAAAEAAIAQGQYKSALIHCKAALKADRTSSDALLLIGKAACCLNEYSQGELAYRRALEVKPGLLQAWEGLADLFAATSNVQGEIEANEHLVRFNSTLGFYELQQN